MNYYLKGQGQCEGHGQGQEKVKVEVKFKVRVIVPGTGIRFPENLVKIRQVGASE